MHHKIKSLINHPDFINYGIILAWIIPLLVLNSGEQSLIAHDEGLYATRARFMIDTGDWIHPWDSPHFKTPGPYWMLASFFTLFGTTETTARLPSILASIFSAFVFYHIGKILLNTKKAALLATLCLWVSFLWLQYSRFATPDLPFIALVCLSILAFLKGEKHSSNQPKWKFLAGFCLGLSLLVRSLMVALPIVALSPYLIGYHRRHHHLTSPGLYLGIGVGLVPTIIWIGLCWPRFGLDLVNSLFGFVANLSSEQRHAHGIFYYSWNLALNGFPWFFLALLGLWRSFTHNTLRSNILLLAGAPITLFIFLSAFSTRIPHYALLMYPFVALLAGIELQWLSQPFEHLNKRSRKLIFGTNLSILTLGLILILVSLAIQFNWIKISVGEDSSISLEQYIAIVLALSMSWVIGSSLWLFHQPTRYKNSFIPSWIAGLLLGSWLAFATAGFTGLFGNANPGVKALVQQPAVRQILVEEVVHFGSLHGKMGVLLRFYTPHIGLKVDALQDLPNTGHAWVRVEQLDEIEDLGWTYRSIADLRDWHLIKYMKTREVILHK